MIIPTRRFWWLVAFGIPLALLGAFIPGLERLVLPYNILLFGLLYASRFRIPNLKFLEVTRKTDDVLSVNHANSVSLRISNHSGLPMHAEIVDESPENLVTTENTFNAKIPAGGSYDHVYHVNPIERGRDFFEGTYFRIKAPGGLAIIQTKLDTVQEIRTYPNIKAVEEFDLLNQRGRLSTLGVRRTRYRGIGTEFESLRDYHEDDFRRVDWKSTARRGKLVVRDYELEKNQVVFIAIDAGRLMLSEADGRKKIDHVLDTALILMNAIDRSGDQIGLIVYAEKVIKFIPPRRGRMQIAHILDAVHDLHAAPVQSNFQAAFGYLASRWKRRALIINFTDLEDEHEARNLVRAVSGMRSKHLWFIARILDSRAHQLDSVEAKSGDALYDLGALNWYLRRREEAGNVLQASGLKQIETEAQNLSAALVNAYWSAKETGQL